MKHFVYIKLIINTWVLTIETDDQVIKAYTFSKLIEALDTASLLQLRVDNKLPINQYYKVG